MSRYARVVQESSVFDFHTLCDPIVAFGEKIGVKMAVDYTVARIKSLWTPSEPKAILAPRALLVVEDVDSWWWSALKTIVLYMVIVCLIAVVLGVSYRITTWVATGVIWLVRDGNKDLWVALKGARPVKQLSVEEE